MMRFARIRRTRRLRRPSTQGTPVLEPELTVRADVELLLSDARVSRGITVSGHVYDIHTGLLSTVVEPTSPHQ